MRRFRSRTLAAVLTFLMLLMPVSFGVRNAYASIFGEEVAPILGILAEVAGMSKEFEQISQTVGQMKDTAEEIAKISSSVYNAVYDSYAVVQCADEIVSFGNQIAYFKEYCDANFGAGFEPGIKCCNIGLDMANSLAKEVVNFRGLCRDSTFSFKGFFKDGAGAEKLSGMLGNMLSRIRQAKKDWCELADEVIGDPNKQKEGDAINNAATNKKGVLYPLGDTEKLHDLTGTINLKPKVLLSEDEMNRMHLQASSGNIITVDQAKIDETRDQIRKVVSSSGATASSIAIGIIGIAMTVVNLARYFSGRTEIGAQVPSLFSNFGKVGFGALLYLILYEILKAFI